MNKIFIDDDIASYGISAQYVQEKLNSFSGDVTIEINSGGGSVFEGITIFNAIKAYDRGKVEIIITGIAASIASYIALAGDSIKAYDNATFMIHNAWTFAYGDANELRKTADILEGLSNIILNKYVEITKKEKDEIKSLMDEETYFFGSEILDFGFCDEIISTEQQTPKNEAFALASETFKASCKKQKENFDPVEFVQIAARLVKDENLQLEVSKPSKEHDDKKAQQRKIELEILTREVKI